MKKILLFISLLIISCHNKKEVSYSVDKIKNGVIYEVNIRQYSEIG